MLEISHAYVFSDDPYVREVGYRVFYRNNPQQEELLRTLMEARYNIAKCAGFESFAERANIHSICDTPSKVENFLNHLSSKLLPFSERDRDKLLQL